MVQSRVQECAVVKLGCCRKAGATLEKRAEIKNASAQLNYAVSSCTQNGHAVSGWACAARKAPGYKARPPNMMYIFFCTLSHRKHLVNTNSHHVQTGPLVSAQSLDANPAPWRPERSDRSTRGPCWTFSTLLALATGGRRAAAYQYVTRTLVDMESERPLNTHGDARTPARRTCRGRGGLPLSRVTTSGQLRGSASLSSRRWRLGDLADAVLCCRIPHVASLSLTYLD